jgi:lysophospholipase L1-like esterase
MEEYPYATHLEKGIDNVQVLHRGLPGWTANGMLMDLDGERTGLRAALQRLKQQSTDDEHIHPISLVILLAGTNDMGYGFDDEEITEDLKRLHEVCFENDVPRTIAIGVPPSGYQSMVATAAELAHRVNDSLELFCQESQGKSTYVDFPFEYEKGGVNWNIDTLHFSKEGYKLLGESLVPTVRTVLQSLERSNQPSV